jgi:NADH-quinone oxidoreductase subunit I
MTRYFEFHMEERNQAVIDKNGLLMHGDKFERQIAADRAQDAPYR